ncbi:MAG TPA: hypothetical protein PLN54_02460 [Flavobacteriales bacterium]|nr:hypothetical protein [Flavobacteriales bacterium]
MTRRSFTIGKMVLPLCLLAITSSVLAQSKTDRAEVSWGEAREERKDGRFGGLQHQAQDRVYVIVHRKDDPWLQVFNTDQVLLKEIPLPMEMGREDHSWEELLFLKDRMVFLTSVYTKSEKRTTLYGRSYDLDGLSSIGGMRELMAMDAESKRDRGWFRVEATPDSTGFRLWGTGAGQKEERMVSANVKHFSSELTLLKEEVESYERPYPHDEYDVETTFIEEDGTRYMWVRKHPEKREKKDRKREGKPTYDMVLAVYENGVGKPKLYPIETGDRFLQDLRMTLVEDKNEIICAGFYGIKGAWTVRGAYVLRLDRSTKAVKHESYKEFDRDFITAFMTEKEEKKATKRAERKGEELELYEYDLDEIVLREDGGMVLVGEQYYMYTTTVCTTNQNGGQTCRTVFHYIYNDIIAVSTDAQGNITWAVKIPKRQHTTNDGGYYSSYALAVKGEKMYFVFNDSGKNLFLTPGQKVEQFDLRGKEALITLVTVDIDGRVTREALLAPEKRDAILRPKSCVQTDDARMFIYAQRKKEYRFGTITFQ